MANDSFVRLPLLYTCVRITIAASIIGSARIKMEMAIFTHHGCGSNYTMVLLEGFLVGLKKFQFSKLSWLNFLICILVPYLAF